MTTQELDVLSPDARVLRALFELARLDRPASVGILASCLGMKPTFVALSLVSLEQRGLVRPERARLTLLGLASAARLPALEVAPPAQQPALVVVRQAPRGLAKAQPRRGAPRRSLVVARSGCH